MAMHLEDVCPKTIHDCKYLNIICCKEQGTRKELAEHMENHIKRHLSLAIDKIDDNKDFISCEVKKLTDDKEKMSREIKELNDGKDKMSREIQELKDLMTRKCDFLYNSALKSTLLNRASFKIKNFAEKKEQVEESGLKKVFHSDDFFCLQGYQAKLRVFIQLHEDCLVCIGAYFILIKGPYDDHLEWPFVGKIKFSCKGNKFIPKTAKFSSHLEPLEDIDKSFKKPISENIGIGYFPFLKNDEIKDYVMNDTLKIDIEVSK